VNVANDGDVQAIPRVPSNYGMVFIRQNAAD